MALVDVLDQLDLSDEAKAQIRREHEQETAGTVTELARLRAQAKRKDVDAEVDKLKGLGFSEAPGLLAFVRRTLLSDDGEPGAVLLTDSEMNLSGDDATGASTREEISVAGAVRKVIELLPRNAEGKLNLSDQILASEDHSQADKSGGDGETQEQKTEAARQRLGAPKRTRARYNGGAPATAGGDA